MTWVAGIQNMFDNQLSTNYNGQVIILFVTIKARFLEVDLEKQQQHISLRSETTTSTHT